MEFEKKFGKRNTIDDKDEDGNTPLILGKILIKTNLESQVHARKLFCTECIVRKNVN